MGRGWMRRISQVTPVGVSFLRQWCVATRHRCESWQHSGVALAHTTSTCTQMLGWHGACYAPSMAKSTVDLMKELAKSGRVIVIRLDEAAIEKARKSKEPDVSWVGEVCLVAGDVGRDS